MVLTMSKLSYDETFEVILGWTASWAFLASLWIVYILINIEETRAGFYEVDNKEISSSLDLKEEGVEAEKEPKAEETKEGGAGAVNNKNKRKRFAPMTFKITQFISVGVLDLLTYLLLVQSKSSMWLAGLGSICVFGVFMRFQIGDEIKRQRWDRLVMMMSLFLVISSCMSMSAYAWKSLARGEIYEGPARIIAYDLSNYNNTEHDPSTRTDLMVQWGKDWGCPLSGSKVCQAHVHGAMCQVEQDDATDDEVRFRRILEDGANASDGDNTDGNDEGETTEELEEDKEELETENEQLAEEVEELEAEQDQAEAEEEEVEEIADAEEDEYAAAADEAEEEAYEEELEVEEDYDLDEEILDEEVLEEFADATSDSEDAEIYEEEADEYEEYEGEVEEEYDEIIEDEEDAVEEYEDEEVDAEEKVEELEEGDGEEVEEEEEEELVDEELEEEAEVYEEEEIEEEGEYGGEEMYDEEYEEEEEEEDEEIYEEEEEEEFEEEEEEEEWYWDEVTYEYDDDLYETEYWQYDWDSAWGDYACTDLFDSDVEGGHYDTNTRPGEDDWPYINIYGSCKKCEAYVLDYFAKEAFEEVEIYRQQAILHFVAAMIGFVASLIGYVKYKISPTAENQVELLGSDGGVMA